MIDTTLSTTFIITKTVKVYNCNSVIPYKNVVHNDSVDETPFFAPSTSN